MSYDIYLRDAQGDTIYFENPFDLRGGTYAMGGTTEAWLNVTYNYAPHFYRTMGEKGIRTIYGLTGEASVPILRSAIDALGDDTDPDYWKPTEGNAKAALRNALALALAAPDGIWDGD